MFQSKEVNKVIGDIIKHMTPSRSYENHYNTLKIILEKIMFDMNDFEIVFSMENFLPFVDLFQVENLRIDVCKNILTSCNVEQRTCDPVIINALMFLCHILHDSVNALTVDDERRQIGEIIAAVIRRVDYGRDFEQQLSFYVESRGAFSNIDIVLSQLVQVAKSQYVYCAKINNFIISVCKFFVCSNQTNSKRESYQKNWCICQSLFCLLLYNCTLNWIS